MKGRKYKLEILWDNGVLTEISISEVEKELLEEYGGLFIVAKYELEGEPDAKPVSYQVWDKYDVPQIPISPRAKEAIT